MRKEGEYRVTEKARSLRRNMTKAEVILWSNLRHRALDGARFRRQHPIGAYFADFTCVAAKLIVEVDGYTHWTPEQLAHDARRTKYLQSQGWSVLRVTNTDVYESMDGVWLAIATQRPPPAASRRPPPQAGED